MRARSKPDKWWSTPAIKRKREKAYRHGKDVAVYPREGQVVRSGSEQQPSQPPASLPTLEE